MREPPSLVTWGKYLPLLVLSIFVYCLYAFIGPLAIEYYLFPKEYGYDMESRLDAGVGILVPFCLIWLLGFFTYSRLIVSTRIQNDFIPRSEQYKVKTNKRFGSVSEPVKGWRRFFTMCHGRPKIVSNVDEELGTIGIPYESTEAPTVPDMPDLALYYTSASFACQEDGMPAYCTKCYNWKPPRTHHDSHSGRCVRRLDHFCPWIGGPVSEHNFKFFTQFNFYLFVLSVYAIIAFSVAVHEGRELNQPLNAHFVVVLALASFVAVFCGTIAYACSDQIWHNKTTIEEKFHPNKVSYVAVRMLREPAANAKLPFKTVTYPLVPDASIKPRTFGILRSGPGENIYDLWTLNNIKSVMGCSVWEWFLPITKSPLAGARINRMGPAEQYGWVLSMMVKRTHHESLFDFTAKDSY